MKPSFRHMALASLVSAFAWIDASVNRMIRGESYGKAYIFPSRDKVLADPVMVEGLELATNYHGRKDLWPRFLEVANGQRGDAKIGEEAVSKYFAFVAVTSGLALGFAVGFVAGVVAFMGLG